MRKFFLLFFLAIIAVPSFAQTDSCGLRISLLTCGPGEELYATFGHTAIRVEQPAYGVDEVYNYGMFEFGPDFYPKFIRGKLLYILAIETFPEFLSTYQYEGRSVAAQQILLPCAQKQALWEALRENARPENRRYLYDFLFDNCTTRARDMIGKHAGAPTRFGNVLPEKRLTFRDMLHTYLDRGQQYWSKLGIDLLLGARLDRQVTNGEALFLPEYLMKGAAGATTAGRPLATQPEPILEAKATATKPALLRPALVFGLVLALGVLLSLSKSPVVTTARKIFDQALFLLLGLAGLLLLFMWLGTDHKVCRDNLNLLWALPTHLAAVILAGRHTDGAITYFKVVFWGNLLLLASWPLLPQALNPALIPLICTVIFRSYFLSKKQSHANNIR